MRQSPRACRVKARLTVAEMALRLGISRSHYYKIEQGKRNPSMDIAKQIADVLDTTGGTLFFGCELDAVSTRAARQMSTREVPGVPETTTAGALPVTQPCARA